MTQKWIKSPKLKAVPVNHGTGKSVVTGVVDITFTGRNTVFVTTAAHVNDKKPAIHYQDREWLASEALTRRPDGTWQQLDDSDYGISDRNSLGSGSRTPKTYRAAILAALCATVAEHWTEDLARQAEHASAAQDLNRLEPDRDKLAAELANLDAQIAALRETIKATEG